MKKITINFENFNFFFQPHTHTYNHHITINLELYEPHAILFNINKRDNNLYINVINFFAHSFFDIEKDRVKLGSSSKEFWLLIVL